MSENYPHNQTTTIQVCHFCHRRQEIAYYCENCGMSCCSDCLADEKVDSFVCQECDTKNVQETANKRICNECGSENIVKISQHVKSCPRCHSHRIVNIYEKKEDLEQHFLDLIKNIRNLLDPFKDVINTLHLTRDKIKQARGPPIKCFHFPKMESELISLFKLLEYIEDTLLEKINIYFHHLALNRNYFFEIYSQPNSNVKIIEGILDNLHENYKSIESYIHKKIEKIDEEVDSINNKLNFISKISDYFDEYKRFINLAENEKPIYAIHAKLSNSHNSKGLLQREKGVLFITNYDLSFIHEHGFLKEKQNLIFKAPVEDIIRIKEIGKLFKKLYIEFAYGNYELSLPNDAISRVIEYILLARNFDQTNIYDKKAWQKLNNKDIDLSSLNNFIEEGINSFFSLRCNMNNEKNRASDSQFQDSNGFHPSESIPDNPPSPYDHQNYNPHNNHKNHQNQDHRNNQNYNRQSNQYPNNHRSNSYNQPFHNQKAPYSYNRQTSSYQHGQNNRNPHPKNHYHNQNNRRSHSSDPHCNVRDFDDKFVNQFNPKNYKNRNSNPRSNKSSQRSNKEEKSFLMKKLQRAQEKYGQPFINHVNRFANDFINNQSVNRASQSQLNRSNSNIDFQDYNRNHLSEFFDQDPLSVPPNMNGSFDLDPFQQEIEEIDDEIEDLKAERYSILETIKTLSNKFDDGKITRNDFMKTHMSLKRDLFRVNSKIKNLRLKQESRW
jgi:predicted transcriptional regulator